MPESIPIRGPAALALVLAVVLGPHLQQLSFETMAKLLLLFLAFGMAIMDFKHWAIQSSRQHMKRSLQRIVLDDLLASIFHPETGLISMCMTACLGNFALYSLPTTSEQRVQLMQHALGSFPNCSHPNADACEAERILLSPGGITELLPQAVQAWLETGNSSGACKTYRKDCREKRLIQTVENLSPVLSSQTEPEGVNITLLSDFHSENDDDNSSILSEECSSPTHQQQPFQPATTKIKSSSSTPTPMEIIGSVMSDVTTRHIKSVLEHLPPQSLEVTSLTAAALLWAQFLSSKRARDILWTVLHASVSVTGSAVLVGSLLALFARHQLQESPPRQPPVGSSLSTNLFFVRRTIRKIKNAGGMLKNAMKSMAQSEHARKVQGILAVLVLAYFGRRRIRLSSAR